jgi:hypothetical protein
MQKKFYVYEHLNPITGNVFYVGKGSGHRAHMIRGRTREWLEAVTECEDKGVPYEIRIVAHNLSEPEAFNKESEVITQRDKQGHRLTNKVGKPVSEVAQLGENWDQTEQLRLTVRELRLEQQITTVRMSQMLGISPQGYRKIEKSGKLGLGVGVLCKVLHILGYRLNVEPTDKTPTSNGD